MKIQQLKYLVEISKYGTINMAAKHLFISQPAISKAIKELENELGIEIFYRDNKKRLQFTTDGAELLWYARDLVGQAENIENTFHNKNKNDYVQLTVSSQHYTFVAKAFIDFIDKHSKNPFKLLLREKTTTQIIEDVFTLQSNLGIIVISDSTKKFMQKYLKSKCLEFNQLATVGYHAFIRIGHPLANQESVTIEELSNFPFISYEQESCSLNFAEEAIVLNSKQSINVLDRATMNNIICNTNSYNIGTGILMKKIIENDIISIPISDLTDKIDIGWIRNKNSLTNEATEFIDLCKKYI